MSPKPFQASGATVNIDVSAASQAVSITTGGAYKQVRVTNDGSATAWINFGGSTVTAALASSMPVRSGAREVFTVPAEAGTLYVAAIAAAATGKIYFTPGSGGI